MFPNEYQVHEYRKELLRQAAQQRLIHEVVQHTSLTQRTGQFLLKFGAKLTVEDDRNECYTVESAGRVVMVCAA